MINISAATAVRGWVGLYTRGLTPAERDARRTEIESDLWTHAQEAYELGHGPSSLEAEMLMRLVLGMWDDIAWRRAHGASAPDTGKEFEMRALDLRHPTTVAGIAFAVLYLGLFGIFGLGMAWFVPYAVVFGAAAIAMLIGFLLIGREPGVGAVLAVGGAILFAGFWVAIGMGDGPMWGVLAALPVILLAIARAQQVRATRADSRPIETG